MSELSRQLPAYWLSERVPLHTDKCREAHEPNRPLECTWPGNSAFVPGDHPGGDEYAPHNPWLWSCSGPLGCYFERREFGLVKLIRI